MKETGPSGLCNSCFINRIILFILFYGKIYFYQFFLLIFNFFFNDTDELFKKNGTNSKGNILTLSVCTFPLEPDVIYREQTMHCMYIHKKNPHK